MEPHFWAWLNLCIKFNTHMFEFYDKSQHTSLVWKQVASRVALAKWALLVNWVNPMMTLGNIRKQQSLI